MRRCPKTVGCPGSSPGSARTTSVREHRNQPVSSARRPHLDNSTVDARTAAHQHSGCVRRGSAPGSRGRPQGPGNGDRAYLPIVLLGTPPVEAARAGDSSAKPPLTAACERRAAERHPERVDWRDDSTPAAGAPHARSLHLPRSPKVSGSRHRPQASEGRPDAQRGTACATADSGWPRQREHVLTETNPRLTRRNAAVPRSRSRKPTRAAREPARSASKQKLNPV